MFIKLPSILFLYSLLATSKRRSFEGIPEGKPEELLPELLPQGSILVTQQEVTAEERDVDESLRKRLEARRGLGFRFRADGLGFRVRAKAWRQDKLRWNTAGDPPSFTKTISLSTPACRTCQMCSPSSKMLLLQSSSAPAMPSLQLLFHDYFRLR